MRMHVLSGGRLRMKRHIYSAGADRDAYIELPVSCFLFRHPQGNVLFDTGCHPSVVEDAAGRWGGLARFMTPIHGQDENVVDALSRLGLEPRDIEVVVNSHLHCDHCGCNAFFENATFIAHTHELDTARDPAMEGKGYSRRDWDGAAGFDAVDGERDLFGDGRLVLVPLPGHSPGLIGVLAALDRDGAFLMVSDAVALRENLDREFVPGNTWSPELLLKSYGEIRGIEKSGASVLCGHDPEQWQALARRGGVHE